MHPRGLRDYHGSDDRAYEGLEDVGAHPSDVPNVVTHVVGDDAGVARVVLGDSRLDLADEVSADVSSLGVDATAHAGEQRYRGCAHAEAGDVLYLWAGSKPHGHQRDAKQPEATD